MIVKDDLPEVNYGVTSRDPYGPRCKRADLRPTIGPTSAREACKRSSLHAAYKRNQALDYQKLIAVVPLLSFNN